MSGRWVRYTVGVLVLLLTGCYLASGERIETEPLAPGEEGRLSVEFVSADGSTERELDVGQPNVSVRLVVSVEVEWGELSLGFLDADGSVALVAGAQYGRPARGFQYILSDEAGLVHYRVQAHEARNGTYTIRYALVEATPTPTPSPSPTP